MSLVPRSRFKAESGSLSRRTFLTASIAAGGGLLLTLKLPLSAWGAASGGGPVDLNAFVQIDPDGTVRLIMPYVEMGQGTYTSISMLIAEELEVDLSQVQYEHAPPNDKLYANPLLGFQATGGSTAIRAAYEPMRRAGATARVLLVQAAAQHWSVEPQSCRADRGHVVHVPSGRRLPYGALVGEAAKLPVPEQVALKPLSEHKLIGTAARRLDTPAKVNGTATY